MENVDHWAHPRRSKKLNLLPKGLVKANPAVLDAWLDGVTTQSVGNWPYAVKSHLGL